jgi:hypothetical protein
MSKVIDNNPVAEPSRDDPAVVPYEQVRALTRAEFCALERMSLSTFHKLKRAGLGPDEVHFPGMAFVRITAEARREWHTRIEQWRKSQAAQLEEQRRSASASRAGKKAAASPLHISKRKRA